MQQHCAAFGLLVVDGLQRLLQYRRDPRISRGLGLVLVGDEFGLHGHPDKLVDCLDPVLKGGDTAVRERDQAR